MNVIELSDIVMVKIILKRDTEGKKRWCADFEKCKIGRNGILGASWGFGETIQEALNAFTENIRGKKLVFNASSPDRRKEFGVPQSLQTLQPGMW